MCVWSQDLRSPSPIMAPGTHQNFGCHVTVRTKTKTLKKRISPLPWVRLYASLILDIHVAVN